MKSLSEKYLSDVLKELLTTSGSKFHPFGVEFAKLFANKILGYKTFALQNSSVIREYPVNVKLNRGHTTKYLDLVFLDLDKGNNKDDFVIGIENKFLTEDSVNQLNDYYTSLKNIFNVVTDIKIVYLTLDRRQPKCSHNIGSDLICLSWIDDILCMLMSLIYSATFDFNCNKAVENWGKGRNPKYKGKELNKDLINFISKLIKIKKLPKTNLQNCKFNEFIECLHKKYGKDKNKRYKVNILDTGNYCLFEHNYYKTKLHRVFIPKSIHPDQAAHMIHQFYLHIWNENYKDIDCNIDELKKYFNKGNIQNIGKQITIYLNSKKDDG